MNDEIDDVMEHVETGLTEQGVACVAVKDGELFAFTRATVENLLKKMNESKQDKIIVFVKGGQRLRKA
jgi:hypothetical protein